MVSHAMKHLPLQVMNKLSWLNSFISLGIFLVIIVLANIAGQLYFKRFDLTTDHRYSLNDFSKNQLENLSSQLTKATFIVNGKSTFKEEFVTAGGVNLKEVNFKTFESKYHENLYFAGEVLNIDAVTGGFNFQNAWTGAYLVAKSISK